MLKDTENLKNYHYSQTKSIAIILILFFFEGDCKDNLKFIYNKSILSFH